MSDTRRTKKLQGKTLSPGLGRGTTYIYQDILLGLDEFHEIGDSQVEQELQRYREALDHISDELSALAARVSQEVGANLSDVFQTHITMVQDKALKADVEQAIREGLVSAGTAVRTVFRRWERRFRSMEAEMAREKADDISDLARRLLSALAGIQGHPLEDLPPGTVLVANRLLPTDTIFLARRSASAAVLEVGGPGSHAALFAHEVGLPCVSGLPGVLDAIAPGELALVDADAGQVIIHPDTQQERDFEAKCRRRTQAASRARLRAQQAAITKDGKQIAVMANVGRREDTQQAMENGADGIGLYRIEQIYLGRREPPDAAALYEEMQRTLEPAKGLPVCVRLLDVGADKPLPFLESQHEVNPSLGRRGVRFLHAYPELLEMQLDALLRLSVDFELCILVPMVTLPSDMQIIKQRAIESAIRTKNSAPPKLGAMIEAPAAALSARAIARHAEFLSFGTNDLTQYTFAADRENEAVDAYFDHTHDVIFRLLRIVHEDVPQMPLSLCGELASCSQCTAKILQCGITTLSVAPPSIPDIKEAIRQCHAE